jgi:hypothetical protein
MVHLLPEYSIISQRLHMEVNTSHSYQNINNYIMWRRGGGGGICINVVKNPLQHRGKRSVKYKTISKNLLVLCFQIC